jgi:hypothetical protein
MSRAISISELYGKKRKLLYLAPEWHDLLGDIERKGSTIIWGQSGAGKTTFLCYLVQELSKHERILWNDIEEGDSHSLKVVFQRTNMQNFKNRITVLDKMPISELHTKLDKPKSANIIVINSLQHAMITKKEYLELIRAYPNKKFVWLSHAEGKEPEGRLGRFVRYDSNEAIYIEGFTAFAKSRTKASIPLAFVPKLAQEFHGLSFDNFNTLNPNPNE